MASSALLLLALSSSVSLTGKRHGDARFFPSCIKKVSSTCTPLADTTVFLLCSGRPVWRAQNLWRWVQFMLLIRLSHFLLISNYTLANCCVKFVRGCYRIWPHFRGGTCGCGLQRGLPGWEDLHELQGTSKPTGYIQVTRIRKTFSVSSNNILNIMFVSCGILLYHYQVAS